MQVCVLKKLTCPICGNVNLKIYSFTNYTDKIIKDGVLFCGTCKTSFTIMDRLLELVPLLLVDQEAREYFFNKYKQRINDLGLKQYKDIQKIDKSKFSQQKKQQEHFDWYADSDKQTYLAYEKTPFWQGVDKLVFAKWRDLISEKSWLLDVGCAQGRSTYNIIDMDIQIVGFDISKKMIRQLIARADKDGYSGRSSFFVADASSLPFQPSTFDYILIYGVLHHLPEPRETIKELGRVLKSKGRFFSLENNKTIFRSIFDLLMKIKPIWFDVPGKEPLISEKMLAEWSQGTSLRLETEIKVFLPPHLFNFLSNNSAYKLLKITDSIAGNVPLIRNQGGLIAIKGEKS